jgi:hypothetical protein
VIQWTDGEEYRSPNPGRSELSQKGILIVEQYAGGAWEGCCEVPGGKL